MKIAARTEYACIAVLELAARFEGGQPVRIRDIAERHKIPSRFLVQILLQLKGAGLVDSVRGASGGYRLLRPPHEMTLGEVVAVMEGPQERAPGTAEASSAIVAALRRAWDEAEEARREVLAQITLADLLERAAQRNENMYYI